MRFNPSPREQNLVNESGAVHVSSQCSRVNESHQIGGRKAAQLGFVRCHDLAVSALGGLIAARLSQKLVTAADGQDRSEGKEPCVGVIERVEREPGADADKHDGDSGIAHSRRLGFERGERLAQPLDLAGFRLSDAVQSELFDGGPGHFRSVSNNQNFPAREVLELQAQGLDNRSLLIHLRIVIHKGIEQC